jgi:hypothetical protein
MSRRRQILLDSLLLFLGTGILVRPYFLNKYTDQWPSIESTFIADARFLAAHFPHPRWQPLWYTGTRFDYIYPPALRYGTAILSKITGWWPVKAYHFYTIFFYCLGVVGVYFLARVAGRARGFAILAGAATALVSPCFLFMKDLRVDSSFLTPLRLGVLLRYGEGPHITALSLLPFAIGFSWLALETRRTQWIALAAIFCAAVVSNNFYGATTLAFCYPMLLWSFWVTRRDRPLALPAIAIPVLAYGLMAFWLSPSYLSVTTYNLRYLPHRPATLFSAWLLLLVVTTYVAVSRKVATARPDRAWAVFVIGLVLIFSLDVLGDHYRVFSLLGDPHRLAPELDLTLILGAALGLEWLWNRRILAARIAVCAIAAIALYTTHRYIRLCWHVISRTPDYTQQLEYRVQDWVWKNQPDARVSTAGAVRFWFDAWHGLYQLGGGSDQGQLNPLVADAQWNISTGDNAEQALLWLQAMGTDAVYFAGPKSDEPYKDTVHEERFASLPVLYDDGHDTRLYGVPRRYPVRARIVDTARLRARPPGRELEDLRAYVDIVEHGPDSPVTLARQGADAMVLHAKIAAGQSLLVQETWDPAWRAWVDGKRLPVRKDAMNFMVMDPPPGDRTMRLEFTMPLENRVGWGLTALTAIALAMLAIRKERY